MGEWEAATRSWEKKERKLWWIKYVAAVATTVAAVQAVNTGFEWYAKRVAGLQTMKEAADQHEEMQQETDAKIEKMAERIEAAVDKLGTRVDRMAIRRRR